MTKIVMKQFNVKDIENITLKDGFENFIQEKKSLNCSEDYIYDLTQAYKQWIKYFPEDMLCKTISKNHLLDFYKKKRESNPNIKARSLKTYAMSLRTIFYFFMENNYMPSFEISLPISPDDGKDPFTDEEISRLVKKPNINRCTFGQFRDWCISCFLLGSGIRLKTLVNIKIRDLDFNSGFITLKVLKNNKPYNIPMSENLHKILKEYLEIRKGNEDDFLFCNEYGEKLERSAVQSAMKRYSKKRGVNKHGVHIYRHTFAKYFVLGGGSESELREVLGHCSPDMAHHYIKLYRTDLKRDFNKRNPLDKNSTYIETPKLTKIKMSR